MKKVHKELDIFKKKTNEMELALRRDERIAKLTKQVDCFRTAALEKAKECEEQKKRINELVQKCNLQETEKIVLMNAAKRQKLKTIQVCQALKHQHHNTKELLDISKRQNEIKIKQLLSP